MKFDQLYVMDPRNRGRVMPRASFLLIELIALLALAARLASEPTANLSYLLVAAYAFFGRAHAVRALGLSWLFTMLNPGIAPEATAASVGRYAVIAAAAISVGLRSSLMTNELRVKKSVIATGSVGVFFVLHSLVFSPIKDVSVLKAAAWAIAMTTLMAAWNALPNDDHNRLSRQIFAGLVLVAMTSLPLLAMPVGYLRNDTGFQGVLNHPQAFGATMAILGAWASSRMLATPNPSWRLMAAVTVCLTLIFLSEARTAGLALVVGIAIAAVAAPAMARRSIRSLLPGLRSRRMRLILSLAIAISFLAGPLLGERLAAFITKRSESSHVLDVYEISRGELIRQLWTNVKEHPFTGIGFGISSDPSQMVVERDATLGLPTSAAIEKGLMPLAVLEELGVPGFTLVVLWLWLLARRAAQGGGVATLAVLATLLLVNLGESMLFSPGSMGLLLLVLLAWSATEKPQMQSGSMDGASKPV